MPCKYRIIHNKPDCIGCGACVAVHPDGWEMNDDGKADIIGGEHKKDGTQEKDIKEEQLQLNMEAAESCPVNVIHIKDEENDKELI